jgi:putative heme-binding domain-containing protein
VLDVMKSHAEAQRRGETGNRHSRCASAPLREVLLVSVILGIGSAGSLLFAEERPKANLSSLVGLLELVIEADADSAKQCLQTLGAKICSGEADAATLAELEKRLAPSLSSILKGDPNNPLVPDAALVAALWKDTAALKQVQAYAAAESTPAERRKLALETLVFADDDATLKIVRALLAAKHATAAEDHRAALAALSREDEPEVAEVVLAAYPALAAENQPLAIDLLTQRAEWSKLLVAEVAAGRLQPGILNVNQVRKLHSLEDAELSAAVTKHWGTIRTSRDPARESLVAEMRKLIRATPGDPHRGIAVFTKLCGQCHKIHGQGQEVGPDITSNGRASFEQLLSNVFDPSLVIGASYQARTVRTIDGRVITGLLTEDNEQRVVLKVQGGKLETIAREDVEAMKVSELSLMPEGIEKQLQPQEIADLFAFITLDKHPDDKTSRRIPEK